MRADGSGVREVRRGAGADQRLALAEVLLAGDDPAECAAEVLAWLRASAGVVRGCVGLVDVEAMHCRVVAAVGIDEAPVLAPIPLDRPDDPISTLPVASEPVFFAEPLAGHGLLGGDPFHVLVLRPRSDVDELGLGLMFVSGLGPDLPDEVRWAAAMLGDKLASVRRRRSVSDARHVRERQLMLAVLNAVPDPVLLTDPDGRLLVANARAERLFASRDEESEGRRRAVALNNMLFSAALSSMVFSGQEQPSSSELVLVDPNEGSDLLFELMSHVVRDPGEGTCVVSVLRNVTDLGRAAMEIELAYKKLRASEADVRAQRHRLELIIDSVADPIIVTDPAGEILLMNEPAERVLSVSDDAPPDALRWVRGNEAHFSSFVSNLLFGGHEQRRHRGELGLVSPSTGETLPVEAIAGKVLSEHGELNAVVTILHDRREALERARLYEQLEQAAGELERRVQEATAELVRQNELLRRQALELERASAAKSQFLANMSHELRTPLNAILGYTSMLLAGISGELTPAQRHKAQRIEDNGKNLLAIINEVLDISRIEAGRMPLHVAKLDLRDVVREVVSELEPIITRSQLDVEVELAPALPALHSDRQKVKQIVLNLLGNALKFTREGGVRIRVHGGRGTVAVTVSDTGIGIADADHERIFEEFQQGDSSPTRRYGGTGLGLAICRRLARMLGGDISVQSRLGVGSTFELTLPTRVRKR